MLSSSWKLSSFKVGIKVRSLYFLPLLYLKSDLVLIVLPLQRDVGGLERSVFRQQVPVGGVGDCRQPFLGHHAHGEEAFVRLDP